MKSISAITAFVFMIPPHQEVKFVRPQPVASTEATYSILRAQFDSDWLRKYGRDSAAKVIAVPLDPLPLFRLSKRCQDQTLLILSFEQLIYQAHDKEIAKGTTRITKNGARVLIYGMDFKNQKLNLLFDDLLVDFHGSIDSQSDCPDLLVTLRNKTFHGRSSGVGYTKLKFDTVKQSFIPQDQEIQPDSIQEE